MGKYLDKTGLSILWNKIKSVFLQKSGGTITGDLTVQGTGGIDCEYNVQASGFIHNNPTNANDMLLANGNTLPQNTFSLSGHTHPYLPLAGGSLSKTLRIDCPTSLENNYNEGIRCNLGGLDGWGSVVIGGARGSTSGTGNGVYTLTVNSSLFRLRQNSTDVIYVNTSNNVGIGVLPSYKLHVAGDIYTTTGFKKNGSSDSYVLLGGGGHKALSDFSMAHTHPYLPISGGTVSGDMNVNGTVAVGTEESTSNLNVTGELSVGESSSFANDMTVSGKVTADSFTGNLKGNADTATKLATARTINDTSFDGSASIRTANSWNLSLGITGDAAKYTIFASTPTKNTSSNVGATLLITDLGDYGGTVTGAWLVQLTNRGSVPTMKVIELVGNNQGTVQFGYCMDSTLNYYQFGIYTTSYRADSNITVLRNTGVKIGKLVETTKKPNSWTVSSVTKYSDTGHTHDDRYYTEDEINAKLATKSDKTDVASKMPTSASTSSNSGEVEMLFSNAEGQYLFSASIEPATTNAPGLMSAADKSKLDNALTSHQSIYTLTINVNGVEYEVFKPNVRSSTINITPEILGAAERVHTHPYLPISGGTVTGNLNVSGTLYADQIKGYSENSTNLTLGTGDNSGYIWITDDMFGKNENGEQSWSIGANSGNATFSSVSQTSDQRLKENIQDVSTEFLEKYWDTENGLIHEYDWKKSGKHATGMIAQELLNYIPEAVNYNVEADSYSVDYTSATCKIMGAMFKKIKSLENEIITMKQEIEKLKK